jgi:hypothetical protein
VGEDNDRLLEVLELFAAVSEQVAEEGLLDVEQVGGPGREVAAAEALKGLGVAAHDAADGVLGGVAVLADELFEFAGERRILDEEGVGREDGPVLGAQLFLDRFLVFAGLPGRRP